MQSENANTRQFLSDQLEDAAANANSAQKRQGVPRLALSVMPNGRTQDNDKMTLGLIYIVRNNIGM